MPSKTYDRYLASWYRQNNAWVGQRFSNYVDHNYATAAIHQSSGSSVIYAQTLPDFDNLLAGGSIAKGNLTDVNHTGNVLASNNTLNRYFTDADYCEFNNIRPVHTDTREGSSTLWAVATGGHNQRYSDNNNLYIIMNGGDVLKLLPGGDTQLVTNCSQ